MPIRTMMLIVSGLLISCALGSAAEELRPVTERYAKEQTSEDPSFQRHISPLFGRLGCNGRACHGSFQGRGGFRLSLFGYDFKADHDALLDQADPRVVPEKPAESLIVVKPTDEANHEGGKRYEIGSWQHHLIKRWIEQGAKYDSKSDQKLSRLEITPSELQFGKPAEKTQLRAVAVWPDGTREDVTPLCRFQSNDEQIAKVDADGSVLAGTKGDTHIVVFYDNAVVPVPVLQPVSEFVNSNYPAVVTPTKIDQLVVNKLRKLGIVPSESCSDSELIRRVSLDLTGTLPTANEVAKFLADTSSDKRSQKIEELMSTPAYAAWWATRICDYTGNNSSKLNNFGVLRSVASQQWFEWVEKRIQKNVPYDEIIAGIVLGTSREEKETYTEFCQKMSAIYRKEEGQSYADRSSMPFYWARRNIVQPEDKAIAFAYSFMGVRIQCAQCHKHPFDQWSKDDFDQFKQFFTGIAINNNNNPRAGSSKEEYEALLKELGIDPSKRMNANELRRQMELAVKEGKTVPFPEVYLANRAREQAKRNKDKAQSANLVSARLLGGEAVNLAEFEDLRKPLMDWLRDPSHPYLARAFVNRVWSNYFNVGIVQPADDMSLANPPSNQELLDYLTVGFIEHDYDMKWLHREITNSRTYQLSWKTNETNKLDERNFSRAVPRRLPAEVAVDAVQFATACDEKIDSMRTNLVGRSIAIASAGDPQAAQGPGFALTVFGRSIRESNCDCDRSEEASLLQTVFLQNDREVLGYIESRDGWINQVNRDILVSSSKTNPGSVAKSKELPEQLPVELDVKSRRRIEQAIKSAERKIDRLKKLGKGEQAQSLEQELAALAAKVAGSQPQDQPSAPPAIDPAKIGELIKTAYLRTLSRYPDQEELAATQKYIAESDTPLAGLRGVMWALVNTKEFIVNH